MATVTLKGTPFRTCGELPGTGSAAPDFRLVDSELQDHRLGDFAGRRLVLNIVPSLDTPVCSASAKRFDELARSHAEVTFATVSADLPFAQQRFCSAEGVGNVVMLSAMRDSAFARDYGVRIEEGPMEGLCARAVVIIDDGGQVVYTQLVPEIAEEPDYDDVQRAL
ncbi:MAG: thiol peroxidase [Halorhodospira halophila]|uniref:thiol peroxidase n=1 Tax=Halorhodospira TaxID=85108 RepID=UPI001912E035|nr:MULTISPECIES: thiol peroxidase [Halorhodospira]MBK5936363.1 lipid hydroperoxide peroxidase [Halorhodospira halophila]MBK5943548.1 lipid hydroperoxide peroxidase [Halorhodospira halophila]MCC3750148.1 thiol peroxidase [Halorhodospira halophila]MCG5527078.1 thiol peroxidase [Halorhodospira halophila]MCG5532293.1 thiol peroxidase [Halorhodospira sp. 9621]